VEEEKMRAEEERKRAEEERKSVEGEVADRWRAEEVAAQQGTAAGKGKEK
jgi:hypothetical protein